jgi:mannose PTS system EIIA component
MSVNILLITHNNIGNALIQAATQTFGELPLPMAHLPIHKDCNPDDVIASITPQIKTLSTGGGLLILTDMFGSTPYNIAQAFESRLIRIITGVNLPMIIRIMNYPKLPLGKLAKTALLGGYQSMILCHPKYHRLPAEHRHFITGKIYRHDPKEINHC